MERKPQRKDYYIRKELEKVVEKRNGNIKEEYSYKVITKKNLLYEHLIMFISIGTVIGIIFSIAFYPYWYIMTPLCEIMAIIIWAIYINAWEEYEIELKSFKKREYAKRYINQIVKRGSEVDDYYKENEESK